MTAASKDELRKSVQKIKDRRNLDLDVAAFVEAATVSSRYIDEPYLVGDFSWGPDHYKSLVKSRAGAGLLRRIRSILRRKRVGLFDQ